MKDLRELKSDLEFEIRSAEKLMDAANAENRILTEKEQSDYDGHLRAIDELEKQIQAREDHIRKEKQLAAKREFMNEPAPSKTEPIKTNPTEPKIEFPNRGAAKLKCFKGKPEEAYKFGLWFHANVLGNDAAKRKFREIASSSRALSETSNTAGGALVPTQFADFIINLREEYGVFQNEAFSWPMTSDVAEVPRINGRMSASYFGEGAAMTTSDLAFGSVKLVAKKGGILTYVSNELNEDAMVDVADLIGTEMAHEFAEQIDDAGFNGDGSGTYDGIYGVANRIEDNTSAVSYVNATSGTDTFAEIDAEDLANVQAAVGARVKRSGMCKWFCSQAAFDLVFSRLQMAAGGNTRRETADGAIPTYNGYDIVTSEVLETSSGTVNNTAFLLFGDLRQTAIFGNRRSMDVASSSDFRFSNDQTAIRAIQRFDIQTVPELAATSGVTPMAALIGNS